MLPRRWATAKAGTELEFIVFEHNLRRRVGRALPSG
jgi:hypothetical protein